MAIDDVGERAEASAVARTLDWFDPEFRERTEFDVYDRVRGTPPQRSETSLTGSSRFWRTLPRRRSIRCARCTSISSWRAARAAR